LHQEVWHFQKDMGWGKMKKEKQINKEKMNIKCLFGFHKWEKYMGCNNIGNGKFKQKYICKKCKKIKEIVK